GEGVHLVNCDGPAGQGSFVVYCEDDSNCNHQPRSSKEECDFHQDGFRTWEGTNDSCNFGSQGVTFSWHIDSDAQGRPDYTKVGSGSNGFHEFAIFKDDKHIMWQLQGQTCRSIYY
ncbi:hypothetical protein GQ53DRAFT_619679, partial [Thozetella sp. PMI_491]